MKYTVLLILSQIVISCGLLTTREAEEPVNQRSTYIEPVQPELVFDNLINSLSDKNSLNYISVFSDTFYSSAEFEYVPSSEAAANYTFLNNWSLKDEEQFINKLYSEIESNSEISLVLTDETSSISGSGAVFNFRYRLSIPFSGSSLDDEFEGQVKFELILDDRGYWVISKWEDFETTANPSWSQLKGRQFK